MFERPKPPLIFIPPKAPNPATTVVGTLLLVTTAFSHIRSGTCHVSSVVCLSGLNVSGLRLGCVLIGSRRWGRGNAD